MAFFKSGAIPNLTDWVAYTPTGSWVLNSPTYTGQWRQVGGDAEYRINIALTGAVTNASLTVNLVSGHVIDTAKIPGFATATTALGTGETLTGGATANVPVVVMYQSTTAVLARYILSAAAGVTTSLANFSATVPGTFANGDSVNLNFKVPIVGWNAVG